MIVTTGPYPLTPGQGTSATPPGTVQQLAAVALQNRSPYVLAVQVGAASYSLAPYCADLYPLAAIGTPVTVEPANPSNAAGVVAELTAVWYGPGDVPPTASYPAALPTAADFIAQQTQAYQDSEVLTWLSATTPAAAGGVATVTVATVPAGQTWLVYRLTIANNSTSTPAFALYAGSVAAANLRDQTPIGDANSADMASPIQFTAGQAIIAQWTACSAGAVGTVNLAYRVPA